MSNLSSYRWFSEEMMRARFIGDEAHAAFLETRVNELWEKLTWQERQRVTRASSKRFSSKRPTSE